MPLFRKFQIERKNFRKMKVSLDKNNRSKKGGKVLKKWKMYQTSLINNQNDNLFHTLVFSQVFQCSYYQRVNAAIVKFRKFGILPVSSLYESLTVQRHLFDHIKVKIRATFPLSQPSIHVLHSSLPKAPEVVLNHENY